MDDAKYHGLIMDLGVSEGNDSAYYLAKGFQVLAVEADPRVCIQLRQRFRKEIEDGQFRILNVAAGETFGDLLKIYVHRSHQGISGVSKRKELVDDYLEYEILTVDWNTLLAQYGIPRYLKIDIEGNEVPFLRSMLRASKYPEFVSVECYNFDVIDMLNKMGYRRFKLIDQTVGFVLPERQFEGLSIKVANFSHSSGPFGLDVFQYCDWLDFNEINAAWKTASKNFSRAWYDCHAWMPGGRF